MRKRLCIHLHDYKSFPKEVHDEISKLEDKLLSVEYLETLYDRHEFRSVLSSISEWIKSSFIVGYHYTRANKREIIDQGLLIRSGQEIRDKFIAKHASKFAAEQIKEFDQSWNSYLDNPTSSSRDNKIWFSFSLEGLRNGGADNLLSNFGGEQVYWTIKHKPIFRDIIKSFGESLVIKCRLDPNYLCQPDLEDLGKVVISSYHVLIHPEAQLVDFDGFQEIPVLPSDILSVCSARRFAQGVWQIIPEK